MRFRPRQHLRHAADFSSVRQEGRRIHCGAFILLIRERKTDSEVGPRLGIIASRRVGNAVKRNRGKRLIREIFRHHQSLIPKHQDTVVILQSRFVESSFEELTERFLAAIEKRKPRLEAFPRKHRPAADKCSS